MKLLALDISKRAPGWSVIDFVEGTELHLARWGVIPNEKHTLTYGPYPDCYRLAASDVATPLLALIEEHNPDVVVVEETNLGKNRYTQKLLEFIHLSFQQLVRLHYPDMKLVYISSSQWRSTMGIGLTSAQKYQNGKLSRAKKSAEAKGLKVDKKALGIAGRVTKKHAAVNFVNDKFHLGFKVKDNDIAESICLGLAYINNSPVCDGT